MADTPNEAIASIKTRQNAIDAIDALYGFDTELGRKFLMDTLYESRVNLFDILPDDILISIAKKHIAEDWKIC